MCYKLFQKWKPKTLLQSVSLSLIILNFALRTVRHKEDNLTLPIPMNLQSCPYALHLLSHLITLVFLNSLFSHSKLYWYNFLSSVLHLRDSFLIPQLYEKPPCSLWSFFQITKHIPDSCYSLLMNIHLLKRQPHSTSRAGVCKPVCLDVSPSLVRSWASSFNVLLP